MMRNTLQAFASTCLLLSVLSQPGCQTQEDSRETSHKRNISLDGQSNFRDLGGYQTNDGCMVKRGIIYRSGELPKLTDRDLNILKDLGIKTVVSFLTDKEIEARGSDRLPEGVQLIHGPIETDEGELVQTVLEARMTADFSKVPPDLNLQIHRLLVEDKTARAEYGNLLKLVAEPQNHPLVFHCSHGVHRTGTGAAILLWSLGVPWETIREDYLLSNKYREEEVKQRLDFFRQEAANNQGVSIDAVDMTNFEAFYILKGEYIDAARDQIITSYGGIEGFLKDGLKLTEAEINNLRQQLLE